MLSLPDGCLVYLTDVTYGAERRGAVGRSVGTYGAERRGGAKRRALFKNIWPSDAYFASGCLAENQCLV